MLLLTFKLCGFFKSDHEKQISHRKNKWRNRQYFELCLFCHLDVQNFNLLDASPLQPEGHVANVQSSPLATGILTFVALGFFLCCDHLKVRVPQFQVDGRRKRGFARAATRVHTSGLARIWRDMDAAGHQL